MIRMLAMRRSEVNYTDWLIDWLNSVKRSITNNSEQFWISYVKIVISSRYNVNIDVNSYL